MIGKVVTRGFSTGVTHQPGVKYVPTRGYTSGESLIPTKAAVGRLPERRRVGILKPR